MMKYEDEVIFNLNSGIKRFGFNLRRTCIICQLYSLTKLYQNFIFIRIYK